MVGALIGLLIIVAIVLVLLKVAVAGGILGLIALILLDPSPARPDLQNLSSG